MVENVDLAFDNVDDILCIELHLLLVYTAILTGSIPCNPPLWNESNDKLLMLCRRPFGEHRIGLLRRLLDLGMENDLKWSLIGIDSNREYSGFNHQNYFLTTPDEYITQCLEFLPGMSEADVRKFIEKNSRTFGTITNATNTDGNGIEDMYSSVIGEIVSETHNIFTHPVFLTEKTFKSIANHMPFLIAGCPGGEKRLKNMGFQTFDIDNTVSILDQKIITLLKNYE
jgi:hypothetical protein